MHLREAFGVREKHFKPVVSASKMLEDGRAQVERKQKALTHEDICKAL